MHVNITLNLQPTQRKPIFRNKKKKKHIKTSYHHL